MSEQVVEEVKFERRDRFMRQQQRIAAKRAKSFIGRRLEMLVEGLGEDEDGAPVVAGRTYREAPEVDGMVFARGAASVGSSVMVTIEDAAAYDLFGTVVNDAIRDESSARRLPGHA